MIDLLKGVGVALVTPMNKDYSIDFPSLEKVVEHVISGGVDYLVIQGTTGESPVFSWQEKLVLLDFVSKVNNERKPLVFGLGGNDTFDLIKKSVDLKEYKLAAILSVSPYYNKPSQQGIIRHFERLADAYPHPIILYNIPSRTASNMEAETTLELSKHSNIVAMKEASGTLNQFKEIESNKPSDFLLLSGDDVLTHDMIKLGADGVISVVANLFPRDFTKMVKSGMEGDFVQSKKLDNSLFTAYTLSTKEGNPTSIKAGLEAKNICMRTVKPPLFDASDELIREWEHLI